MDMKKRDVEAILRAEKPHLKKKFFVKEIGIFGSYSRGEAKAGSDVDILVEFSKPVGWEFIDLKEHLEKLFGKKVDLVTVKALRPEMKKEILREVLYA